MDGEHLVGGDPAPGDPTGIRVLARDIDPVSSSAQQTRLVLDGIGSDLAVTPWSGTTADKFREVFGEIAPDLGLMALSYDRVAGSLRVYADHLEVLQAAARQAVERARIAKAQAERSEAELRQASDAVRRLTGQVRSARATEASARHTFEAAPPGDPTAVQLHRLYIEARDARAALERDLNGVRGREHEARRALDRAEDELREAWARADALREERNRYEHAAAWAIRASLDQALRNKTFLEQAGVWLVEQVETFVENIERASELAADALAAAMTGDWERVAASLYEFFDLMGSVFEVLLHLVHILAFIFPALDVVVAALAILVLVCAVAKAITGIVMAGKGWTDTQGRPVTWIDVTFDAVDVVVAAASVRAPMKGLNGPRLAAFSRVKRVLYWNDARHANGFLRRVHVAPREQTREFIKDGANSFIEAGAKRFIGDGVKDFIEEKAQRGLERFREELGKEHEAYRQGCRQGSTGAAYAGGGGGAW